MRKERVQKLLDLKSFSKAQIEMAVKLSKEALEVECAKLDCAVGMLERTAEEFTRKQGSLFINAPELDYFYNYFEYLYRQIEQQKQTVTEKITEVERMQKTLLKAHGEKRLCEILYDKLTSDQARETGKNEQKEADFKFISRKFRR